MSRPRHEDPYGLRRVRVRRRADALAIPAGAVSLPLRHDATASDNGDDADSDDVVVVRTLDRRHRQRQRAERLHEASHDVSGESFTDAPPSEPDDRSEPSSDTDDGSEGRAANPSAWLAEAWRTVEPEAVDHVLRAMHEMLRAARLVIDAAEVVLTQQQGRRGRRTSAPRVRRIDLD